MDALQQTVDPNLRWYVELDHSSVFGLFEGDDLAAAASHFVFDEHPVAAAGVLVRPDCRRRGLGTAVVSAAVTWALERRLTVEWRTNNKNLGSLGIARRLGFVLDCVETEFRIGTSAPV